ncbi:MAG: serine acetyltransferase [Clostridia bacterium]|nr:serine acetyltransferase [Clostridia bacterium]
MKTRKELYEYIEQDAKANGRTKSKADFFGDMCWKFQVTLRKFEYYTSCGRQKSLLFPFYVYYRLRLQHLSVKLGFTIPAHRIGKGFSIAHRGTIVVSTASTIGENCRIHEGVTIGATNGSLNAPQIGSNVFIATGAKIIGDITIADDVCIAANAVVTKSITEPGTTWGGIPAKKISDKSSRANLSDLLFEK